MRPTISLAILALLAGPSSAEANGFSADIELLKPTFSAGSLPGVDDPTVGAPGTTRWGLLMQIEKDPLVLYENGVESGAVVRWRSVGYLGLSHDFTDRVSARVVLPAAWQWGSDVARFAASGPGLGDASGGMRLELVESGAFGLGLRGDVYLPLGRREAWLGEAHPRLSTALLAAVPVGPLIAQVDAGLTSRSPVDTTQDFELGPELALNGGLQIPFPARDLSLQASVLSRAGFGEVLGGGAENSVEAVGTVSFAPSSSWSIDLGAGRGLTYGYGTTDWRLVSMVTFRRAAQPEPPEVVEELQFEVEGLEDRVVVVEQEPEPLEPIAEWDDGQLARVEHNAIVLRDPVHFELGTAKIRPESLPALHHVGGLMAQHPNILHVVIEGHASEEGTYAYNYDLSIDRARAIFEELVAVGVHPSRLSYRGMGEVVPLADTAVEGNRRVEFDIVRLAAPEEAAPEYIDAPLPWNGEPVTRKEETR